MSSRKSDAESNAKKLKWITPKRSSLVHFADFIAQADCTGNGYTGSCAGSGTHYSSSGHGCVSGQSTG
jgi:hypothetical protein